MSQAVCMRAESWRSSASASIRFGLRRQLAWRQQQNASDNSSFGSTNRSWIEWNSEFDQSCVDLGRFGIQLPWLSKVGEDFLSVSGWPRVEELAAPAEDHHHHHLARARHLSSWPQSADQPIGAKANWHQCAELLPSKPSSFVASKISSLRQAGWVGGWHKTRAGQVIALVIGRQLTLLADGAAASTL